MSANTKQQKERDKAIRHLFDYINSSEKWGPRIEQMTDHFMRPVVESLLQNNGIGGDSFNISMDGGWHYVVKPSDFRIVKCPARTVFEYRHQPLNIY